MMAFNHLVLGMLWILYGVLHSALATTRVKAAAARAMGTAFRHYRLLYTLFAFLSLAALVIWQVSLPSPLLLSSSRAIMFGGVAVGVAGLVLMGICFKNYFLSLSGLRSLWQPEDRPALIIKGVHRRVRHPLYLGTFVFIWGLFLLAPRLSLLIADSVITAYTLIAIRWEERKLIGLFGSQYHEYRRTVPKLLPSLRPHRTP